MDKKKPLCGRSITVDMRNNLRWQSVYLLDLLEGLWRQPKAKLELSNAEIALEFDWSTSTVTRSIKELEQQGYIRREYGSEGRSLVPGATIAQKKKPTKEKKVKPTPSVVVEDSEEPRKQHKIYTQLWFTQKQWEKLVARYTHEGLSREDLNAALELLNTWADENPKKWARKKDHYLNAINWPLERIMQKKIKRLELERQENYTAISEKRRLQEGDGEY